MLSSAIPFSPGHRDEKVAWHYGDPLGEQRKLAAGVGSVDMSNRGVIRLSGDDRLEYLNSLTTQKLLLMKPGESAITLDLNPQGFVLHEIHVICGESELWLTCEADSTAELLTYLQKMKFRSRIAVDEVSADWSVVWQPVSQVHPEFATWLSPFDWDAREILLPANQVDEFVSAAPAGMWAYSAMRIAARVPRQGSETDHRTVPHEVGWIGTAVDLNKGCYRGQETVSKIERMGQPPRRMTTLLLDGAEELPTHLTEIRLGERVIGFIGESVQHFELGPIASAVIRRDTPAGIDLSVGENLVRELVVK